MVVWDVDWATVSWHAIDRHLALRLLASLVSLLEQYVADQGGMSRAEARAWADEQRELGDRGEFFFTVTQFCFTATRRS